jgi:hypothetical protein
MFHHVFYSAISIVVNLAFAILPSAPLLAVKRIPASSTKNILVQDQARVGSFGQQPAKVRDGIDEAARPAGAKSNPSQCDRA